MRSEKLEVRGENLKRKLNTKVRKRLNRRKLNEKGKNRRSLFEARDFFQKRVIAI